jgi:hypothetical protein
MFHRAFSRFFIPLLCAGMAPAAALAQTDSKGFYITVYGQHSRIGSSNMAESGTLGAGVGLRAEFASGTGFGGDIGYRYGNGWAAEVEWNYRRHSLDSLRRGSANLSRDGDFASNILLINGLRRFAAKGAWTPYAGARWLRVGSVRLNNETGNPGGSAGPLKYNPFSVQVGIRRSF